jgi:hypothetical protein
MLGIKHFDSALYLILGAKTKNCSAAVPDGPGKCAVNAAYSVVLIKGIGKLPHKLNNGIVEIPENRKSRQMPVNIITHYNSP